MGANGCKFILHCTSMLPPMKESCPQLCAAKLIYIHVTKGDQAL